jgi:hypothetical protein
MVYGLWSMVYGLWSLASEGLAEPVSRVYLRPWLSPHRESKSVSLGPDTADPAGQSCRRPAQYQMRTHHACACSCRVHQPRPGPSRPVQARPGPSRPVQARPGPSRPAISRVLACAAPDTRAGVAGICGTALYLRVWVYLHPPSTAGHRSPCLGVCCFREERVPAVSVPRCVSPHYCGTPGASVPANHDQRAHARMHACGHAGTV